jgi:G3E family GTPase
MLTTMKATLISMVRQLNPVAQVIPTEFCKVDLKQVLGTGRCTQEFSESVRGWMTDLAETHTPETEEYGVRNFIFQSNRPFHPLRLHQWISSLYIVEEMKDDDDNDEEKESGDDDDDLQQQSNEEINSRKKKEQRTIDAIAVRQNRIERYGGEIFRVKGFAWLGNPSRLGFFVSISAAGDVMSFLPGGGWGTFPVRAGRGTASVEPGQKLAFMGQYLDKERMISDLEKLLLTKDEEVELKKVMMAAAKSQEPPADIFDDPFEPFGREEHS